jgi:putative ABC transport system permease protein
MSVSSDFFTVLGVQAEQGRTFSTGDGPGAHLAVLSQRIWLSTFHGDRGVVGRAVTINGEPFVVTGILPASFTLPSITPKPAGDTGPDLWIPADVHEIPLMPIASSNDLRTNRAIGYLRAIGRLRPGVTLERAEREVSELSGRLARDYPADNARVGATLEPFGPYLVQDVRQPLAVLFGAVTIVLAIACANIAGLLLGRAQSRRQEMAVRLALGASRWRVTRQLLTENLLLGSVAAGVGVFVGKFMLAWLASVGPASLLRLSQASMDGRAVLFALGLAVLTALIFGTLPAIQASRPRLAVELSAGSRRSSETPARQRMRRVLVAGEVALACTLLTSAALLGRSLWTLVRVDPGYDAKQVLAFFLVLSGPDAKSPSHETMLYESLLARIRAMPGVISAAAVANLPVGGDDFGVPVVVEGAPPDEPGKRPRVNYQVASADYFKTMRVPVASGREFAPSDTRDAPSVAIVNDAFVRRYWPNGDAIGRRVKFGAATSWTTIVGVVGNVRHGGFAAPIRIEIYTPSTQTPFSFTSFVVRAEGDPLALAPAIRQALLELDATVPISGVSTLESRLRASVGDTSFLSFLLVAFAIVAVLVASVGIYGVVALGVVQRTREIGVRMALGASSRQVLTLLVGQGIGSAMAGLGAGLLLSLAAAHALTGLLFGITAHDPAAWLTVPVTLALVALAATYLPARRALRVAPSEALRAD